MSDLAKTTRAAIRTLVSMTPRIDAIGIVVADMAAALDFYRRLGLEVPAGAEAEPHVEVTAPRRVPADVRHPGDDPVVQPVVDSANRWPGDGAGVRLRRSGRRRHRP